MDFDRQYNLMYSVDWFFSSILDTIEIILSKCPAPADPCFHNYTHSIAILKTLGKSRLRIQSTEIRERREDMRQWWSTRHPTNPDKWKPVLVLQFHFHVVMHFFRLCHSQLDPTDILYRYLNTYDIERLDTMETDFLGYLSDIEKKADYRAEIGNSYKWMMDYALEYARLVSASPSHTDTARLVSASPSHTDTGLHALLSQLSTV